MISCHLNIFVAVVKMLSLLMLQVLKPVNQRAQRRVPPPEDVDLEQAIDGAALTRLMAVEVCWRKDKGRYCWWMSRKLRSP